MYPWSMGIRYGIRYRYVSFAKYPRIIGGDMRDFSYQLVRFVCRNMMAISSVSYLVCVLGYVVYLPVK